MRTDLYTKAILTLIAALLALNVFTTQTNMVVRAQSDTRYRAVQLPSPGQLNGGAVEFSRRLSDAAGGANPSELVQLVPNDQGFLAVFTQVAVHRTR
jgi:hypothetical protein